jgi:hypothetical protein
VPSGENDIGGEVAAASGVNVGGRDAAADRVGSKVAGVVTGSKKEGRRTATGATAVPMPLFRKAFGCGVGFTLDGRAGTFRTKVSGFGALVTTAGGFMTGFGFAVIGLGLDTMDVRGPVSVEVALT